MVDKINGEKQKPFQTVKLAQTYPRKNGQSRVR